MSWYVNDNTVVVFSEVDWRPVSVETMELARQAVQSCESRKHEDVQAWAERLAQDVGHLKPVRGVFEKVKSGGISRSDRRE